MRSRADQWYMHFGWRRSACLALVAFGAVWVAWLGFRGQTGGDYPVDYAPAMDALLTGHLGAFVDHLPTNGAGGSVLLRAPTALIGKLLVGSPMAIFRFGALAGTLAVGALGIYLARGMRAAHRPALSRAAVIGLCLLSPAILDAVFFGHPEEPLGAAICVAAVLLAGQQRATLAGVALGLALINKPWGVLAVAPVLLASGGGWLRVASVAGAIVGAWIAGAYIGSPAHFSRAVVGASTAVVAHPVDLWWPLSHLRSVPGVTPAYFPPRLVSDHARELAVLLALPLSLPLTRVRGRTTDNCLALVALLFLTRCVLDPSNHVYYQVPLIIALTAWESRVRGAPLLALSATAAFWLVFHVISGTGSLTAQFAAYLAITLPLAALLVRPAFGIAIRPASAPRARGLSTA